MEERPYGTLGRYGLASSYSYLDGVPFKIGPKFKQPPKISVPSDIIKDNAERLLSFEYTYETEDAVLAWAKAREEALHKAAKEQAEKLQQEKEIHNRLDSEAAAPLNPKERESSESREVETSAYDVPKSTSPMGIEKPKPRVAPKPTPRPVSASGAILKPIPIQANVAGHPPPDIQHGDNKFDVSMFEQEADPFENLELQTINDMEELKVLLDTKPAPAPRKKLNESQPITSPSTDAFAVANEKEDSETIYDFAEEVAKNTWVTFDEEKDNYNKPCQDKEWKTQSNTLEQGLNFSQEDGEYVALAKESKHFDCVHYSVNGIHKNVSELQISNGDDVSPGDKLAPNLSENKLFKPVLPPIQGHQNLHENCDNSQVSVPENKINFSNPFLSQSLNPFMQGAGEAVSAFTTNISATISTSSSPFSILSASNQNNPSGPSTMSGLMLHRPVPTPPVASKPDVSNSRMWSSVGPSLDDSVVRPSANLMKNPYSRHSASTTDLQTSGIEIDSTRKSLEPLPSFSPQLVSGSGLNKLRPLPPPPPLSPKPEVYKKSQLSNTQPIGLTDPYYNLSREAQTFTDSLSSMGFRKARVARAVQKFGQDEKEVLDHLLAVDKLVERRYAPVLVESALYTFKNDTEKAEKFLQMLNQFEELGFNRETIKDALVTTDMDHDKALDLLTA